MPTFRGRPACSCLVAWIPAYEAELQRRGILAPGATLTIYQLIGGAAASGGTHATGGAFDTRYYGPESIAVARQMGADATWLRPSNWDSKGGIAHVHGVLRGCPHNGPARYQIDAVDAGFNGLGAGGRSRPDDGPRPLSGRTWREGIAWAEELGDDMPKYREWDQVDRDALSGDVAAKVIEALGKVKLTAPNGKTKVAFFTWLEAWRKKDQ